MHVFIPSAYNNAQKSPCILMLHGAVGQSKFSDIDSTAAADEDIMFDVLKKQNYIIIRPLGDRSKKFDWVVNRFGTWTQQQPNLTYKTLAAALQSLKKVLNIDDNRVFTFGHSDGSDGAVGLAIYTPDAFAGVLGYNSMLANLVTNDYFIKNTVNKPLYLVHSDRDDLRPMQMTRDVVNKLKATGSNISYKEYVGYEHYDKHLTIDMPAAVKFINGTKRNPYPAKVEWTTAYDTIYNACDWLKITKIDTLRSRAEWDTLFNTNSFDKINKRYYNYGYYRYEKKYGAVKATYAANVFNIQTSRVAGVEIKISSAMVDLNEPVIVKLNGRQVFREKVKADKAYLLNSFKQNADREALWINHIQVQVN
jgi:predicted esterase